MLKLMFESLLSNYQFLAQHLQLGSVENYGISYTLVTGAVSSAACVSLRLYRRLFFSCLTISTVPCSRVSPDESIGSLR